MRNTDRHEQRPGGRRPSPIVSQPSSKRSFDMPIPGAKFPSRRGHAANSAPDGRHRPGLRGEPETDTEQTTRILSAGLIAELQAADLIVIAHPC